MKEDAISYYKGISLSIFGDVPTFCDAWNDLEFFIHFNKTIEKLIGRPHDFEVASERWIKGSNAIAFVVSEDIRLVRLTDRAAEKEKDYIYI